jgi:shikimate dehydrogenase
VKIFGLVGDPVGHSLSPVMHEAAFHELGLNAEYRLVRVPADRPGDVRPAIGDLASSGGGNVTVPHKQTAAGVLDIASEDVLLTGACNCFWSDGVGRLHGDNTDVGGILAVLQSTPGLDPVGASVLVLGAGGAARAAVVASSRAGAAGISVLNRSPNPVAALVEQLATVCRAPISIAPNPIDPGSYDLVIQATRLGLNPGDPLPLEIGDAPPEFAFDLVYAQGETRWTKHARERGAQARDGLAVLLEQGVLSLERWLARPMPLAVRNAMWKSLQNAVR